MPSASPYQWTLPYIRGRWAQVGSLLARCFIRQHSISWEDSLNLGFAFLAAGMVWPLDDEFIFACTVASSQLRAVSVFSTLVEEPRSTDPARVPYPVVWKACMDPSFPPPQGEKPLVSYIFLPAYERGRRVTCMAAPDHEHSGLGMG